MRELSPLTRMAPPKYLAIASRKQSERLSRIPSEWRLSSPPADTVSNVLDVPRKCGLLTQRELEITEAYDATALAAKLREKVFSCVEVATAFCKRAAIAQQVVR